MYPTMQSEMVRVARLYGETYTEEELVAAARMPWSNARRYNAAREAAEGKSLERNAAALWWQGPKGIDALASLIKGDVEITIRNHLKDDLEAMTNAAGLESVTLQFERTHSLPYPSGASGEALWKVTLAPTVVSIF